MHKETKQLLANMNKIKDLADDKYFQTHFITDPKDPHRKYFIIDMTDPEYRKLLNSVFKKQIKYLPDNTVITREWINIDHIFSNDILLPNNDVIFHQDGKWFEKEQADKELAKWVKKYGKKADEYLKKEGI